MDKLIGNALKEKRKERKLSIQEASKQTFIKPIYLQMLEDGIMDRFPSKTQGLGFLKNYASFLSIDLSLFDKKTETLIDEPFSEHVLLEIDEQEKTNFSDEKEDKFDVYENIFNGVNIEESIPSKTQPPLENTDSFSIGERLKKRRETLGASVEEIAKHLKIPAHYLRIIEKNDFSLFSSSVQARGMLLSYAEFLSVEKEWVLEKFGDQVQDNFIENNEQLGPYDEKNEVPKVSSIFWVWMRDVFSVDMFVVIVCILLVVGFGIWGVRRVVFTRNTLATVETYATPTAVMAETAMVEETILPEVNETIVVDLTVDDNNLNIVATNTAIPIAPGGTTVTVVVNVLQRTYLEVEVDGEEQLRKRVLPNSEFYFFGEESITLVAGNAAGLIITHNGVVYESLGGVGEVFEANYLLNSVVTPAPLPSATPIPTITPETPLEEEPMTDEMAQ